MILSFKDYEFFPRVPTESDIAKALKELEKKFVENNNISHIKQLLKITMSARRSWIEKESSGIVEIVSKYPSLKYYEIVRSFIFFIFY